MDIDSIPFGEDFREHIETAVAKCDVVLAVIGTKWAGNLTPNDGSITRETSSGLS